MARASSCYPCRMAHKEVCHSQMPLCRNLATFNTTSSAPNLSSMAECKYCASDAKRGTLHFCPARQDRELSIIPYVNIHLLLLWLQFWLSKVRGCYRDLSFKCSTTYWRAWSEASYWRGSFTSSWSKIGGTSNTCRSAREHCSRAIWGARNWKCCWVDVN